ncbi:hypothetical protein HY227_02330, partial [Candidatus Wolfebacteria bacterium]|nr:hypothetical protein [Candidatus Wolfebacteria bacterium]
MNKIILLNWSIRGVVSNEETFWSVLLKNLSGAEAIALKSFRGDIEEYVREKAPDIIIFNSILGDIGVPQGIKKIALLQDNFVVMRKLLPFNWKRLVKWILNLCKDDYLIKEKRQKDAILNSDIIV